MRVQVQYTFPPPEGESPHAAGVREKRHDQRERAAIMCLNDSQQMRADEASSSHAAAVCSATTELMRNARRLVVDNTGNVLLVTPPASSLPTVAAGTVPTRAATRLDR